MKRQSMKRALPLIVAILVCLAITPAASEKPAPFVLTPSVLLLDIGATAVITASGPVKSWSSSDVTVAVFAGAGVVRAVGAGEAVITAKNGPYIAQTYVTVVDPNQPPPPPPPPVIEPLVVSCPANQAVVSEDGAPVPVVFSGTSAGGVAPVSVTAAPASGSTFPVGSTAVQVSAASSDGQVSSCAFNVTVSVPAPIPPPVTGRGPQPSITCPAGAISIPPGQSIQNAVNAATGVTTFCLRAGTHQVTGAITPKTGNVFVGEYGAILDGTGWVTTDSQQGAFRAVNVNVDNVTIRNLVIRNMPQRGIYASKSLSDGWLIEHNEIHANRFGFHAGNTFTIRRNLIHHNIGIPSSLIYEERGGAYAAYQATGVVMEDNEIAHNGPEHKWVGTNGVVTRGNWVHHNHTDGIWYDADNINMLVEDNVVEDQPRTGIFLEISGNGIVRNNVVRRTGPTLPASGIFVSASKGLELHGNVLEENFRGITYYVDCSRIGGGSISGGWDLANNSAHDNVVKLKAAPAQGSTTNSLQTGVDCTAAQKLLYNGGSKNLTFTGNDYYVPTLAGLWFYWDAYKTFAGWQALGQDAGGAVVVP
jgi:parallel beta-helix repeat protein